MNVEQRLIEVFQTSELVESTPDLWSRVVHSIEEDRLHRMRVIRWSAFATALALGLLIVGWLSYRSGVGGGQGHVHRPMMEVLETITLGAVLVTAGPAIRRFGRGYAEGLFPAGSTTPGALLRLLDVGYFLVGAGYILLGVEFEFSDTAFFRDTLGQQLGAASMRLGGLLLVLGILHAVTLVLLPVVAIVANATRRSTPIPRWVMLLFVAAVLSVAPFLQLAIGLGLFAE